MDDPSSSHYRLLRKTIRFVESRSATPTTKATATTTATTENQAGDDPNFRRRR